MSYCSLANHIESETSGHSKPDRSGAPEADERGDGSACPRCCVAIARLENSIRDDRVWRREHRHRSGGQCAASRWRRHAQAGLRAHARALAPRLGRRIRTRPGEGERSENAAIRAKRVICAQVDLGAEMDWSSRPHPRASRRRAPNWNSHGSWSRLDGDATERVFRGCSLRASLASTEWAISARGACKHRLVVGTPMVRQIPSNTTLGGRDWDTIRNFG